MIIAKENYRNGYSNKIVNSSQGDINLNVPRDRNGSFDPIVVEKGQKANIFFFPSNMFFIQSLNEKAY